MKDKVKILNISKRLVKDCIDYKHVHWIKTVSADVGRTNGLIQFIQIANGISIFSFELSD